MSTTSYIHKLMVSTLQASTSCISMQTQAQKQAFNEADTRASHLVSEVMQTVHQQTHARMSSGSFPHPSRRLSSLSLSPSIPDRDPQSCKSWRVWSGRFTPEQLVALEVVDHAGVKQLLHKVGLLAQHGHGGAVGLDGLEALRRLHLALQDEAPHLHKQVTCSGKSTPPWYFSGKCRITNSSFQRGSGAPRQGYA